MPKQRAPAIGEEQARLQALRRYDILDTAPESNYDDVTRLAADICDTPIALITFVDSDRQWFKSRRGLSYRQTQREIAFCSQAIEGTDVMLVPDATSDERFRDNPLVTGPPHIVFYAGAPLVTTDGFRIGTVCVIDHRPRTLAEEQVDALRALASQVMANLELRRSLALVELTRASLANEVENRSIAESERQLSDSFMRATIDAMVDHIAIIDSRGNIVHVNRAWETFAAANCPAGLIAETGPGVNYLDICDRAAADGSGEAAEVARALRRVLESEQSDGFNLEYPCHSPEEQRWFIVQLSAFSTGADRYAVVNHHNITERRLAAEKVSKLNTELERRVAERTADLQRAYTTLHASEERLRSLFDNASVGVVVMSPQGELVQINDAYLEMAARSRAELIGRNLSDFVHADDRERLLRSLDELASGRLPGCELELRAAAAGGSWRHLSMSAVRGPDGEIRQIMALVQNLADAKEVEEQRDRFFDRSADMLVIADPRGRFHRANPACERILGYTEEEMCSLDYFQLAHPDERTLVKEELARLAAGEPVGLLEVRMRAKDGQYRDIRWNAAPWTTPGQVLAIGRDNTSRRAAERELREQRLMLQRAEQLAQLGSWQYEFARNAVRCSQGLQNIAGRRHDAGEMLLEQLLGMLAEGDRERLRGTIESVGQSGKSARLSCSVERPDGSLRTVQTTVDVVRDGNGEIYGVIGACLDVTDVNRTLERLRVSQEQLRALTKKLEHIREEERLAISREVHDELGQMLTALKIDLTLLARDVGGGESAMPAAADVRKALQSMERLVDATIDSVRSIAMQLRPELLDAFGLVPAIEWHAADFEDRTKIRCLVEASANEPQLATDVRTAIFRIVQEAMTNVARHAGADLVKVTIRDEGDHVVVAVADNGCGVSHAELARSRSLGVLGMRERAAMIGASFDIRGEPGRGTVVSLRLPVDSKAAGTGGATASDAPA